MSFFSDERSSELRDLFFSSAAELLQTLNEEGLKLEKNPGDPEVLREVRRTVHTLKGDSAGCGYPELSELAHELEDILTPEIASGSKGELAELVLQAADVFSALLAAYRNGSPLPEYGSIRQRIQKLIAAPEKNNGQHLPEHVAWTEYEQMMMEEALRGGQSVFHIRGTLDSGCAMPAAALQMIRSVLQEGGSLIGFYPDDSAALENLDRFEAAVATSQDAEWFEKKCRIPAMVSEVSVQPFPERETETKEVQAAGQEQDLPRILPSEERSGEISGHAEEIPSPADLFPTNFSQEEAAPEEPANIPEAPTVASTPSENLLRVDAERIDTVLNLVGELIIGKSMLAQSMHEFDKRFAKDPLRARLADAMAFQSRVLNDLQKSVMKIRMVPVEQLFRRFPRIVRDTAKLCEKEVELVINGGETDLDKSILDALAEPLSHLVRNAIDHGIESPRERSRAGKSPTGIVRLNAYHQGNQVIIECTDDGKGIDRQKLIAKAIEQGIITFEEASRMNESEGLNLVFHPGLSTAQQVTSVSGRGVGMDVVHSVMERLKGSVSIQSKRGEGTSFYLKMPLTLAIIKALMFRVGERLYAVPLGAVLEITRARESEIHRVDQHEVIQLRDQVLPLVRLNKMAKASPAGQRHFIVVISLSDRKFGLVVERLVGEEELVIKALDDHLVATELVSGASILGDGAVVLILNLSAVVPRFAKLQSMEATA